jgi:N-acetylglutamate synthase-like GNAT family acetyltransferase
VTIVVRAATRDDADELARLRWDFRVEHGTPVTRAFEEFASEFRAFVTDALAEGASWRAWVAQADGRLVGCIWLQLVEKVPHPSRGRWERPIAYVTNAYVEPDLRDAGLGARLLDTAMTFAREQRMSEAIVWPTPRSVSFYRRAGFGTGSAPLGMDPAGD